MKVASTSFFDDVGDAADQVRTIVGSVGENIAGAAQETAYVVKTAAGYAVATVRAATGSTARTTPPKP